MTWSKNKTNGVLTLVEFVGFVGTVISTARAAPRIARKIEDVDISEDTTIPQKAIIYTRAIGKDCITPLIFSTVTVTAMLAKDHQHKSQAAIASSYTLGKRLYDENRERIKQVMNDISPDTDNPNFFDNIEESRNGEPKNRKDIFYLEWSGRRFKSSKADVIEALELAKEQYNKRGCISFNDLYLYLGIVETKCGVQNGFADMGRMNHPELPKEEWDPIDIYIREVENPKKEGQIIYMICAGNSIEHVYWYEQILDLEERFDFEGSNREGEIWNSL